MLDTKRDILNKTISSVIRKQEEKALREQLDQFVERLRAEELGRYNRAVKKIKTEHDRILQLIDEKAGEVESIRLGLPLKAKYLEMEETMVEGEIRRRWGAVLSALAEPNTEEDD